MPPVEGAPLGRQQAASWPGEQAASWPGEQAASWPGERLAPSCERGALEQAALFGPTIHVTRPLSRQRRRHELLERLGRALPYFPELDGQRVTVGFTREAEGMAIYEDMTVRFDVRRRVPSYYTIGHELTHLLQALKQIPEGEVQCDIWTLARSRLFTDEAPCYLPLPPQVSRNWRRYALRVHYLCGRAIGERARRRTYIVWLKSKLATLV